MLIVGIKPVSPVQNSPARANKQTPGVVKTFHTILNILCVIRFELKPDIESFNSQYTWWLCVIRIEMKPDNDPSNTQ